MQQSLFQEIATAQRGSDTHGLLEKIAFHLHLKNKAHSQDSNWFIAQSTLLRWAGYQREHSTDFEPPLENSLHRLLNHYAYDHSDFPLCLEDKPEIPSSPFNDWMYAQDRLAKQILHQVTRI